MTLNMTAEELAALIAHDVDLREHIQGYSSWYITKINFPFEFYQFS